MQAFIVNICTLILVASLYCLPSVALAKKQSESSKQKNTANETVNAENAGKIHFDKIVDEVSAGIQMVYTEKMLSGGRGEYPKVLDKQPQGVCKSCFSDVLEKGLNDSRWIKKSGEYTFSDGSFSGKFSYDSVTGKITRD